jgi:hypothetical protein
MAERKDWESLLTSDYDELGLTSFSLPEHYLMLAVLMRAIFDCVGVGQVQLEDRRSAERFFYSKEEGKERWIYSFYSISEHLSADPQEFRRRVLSFLGKAGAGVPGMNRPRRVVEPQ